MMNYLKDFFICFTLIIFVKSFVPFQISHSCSTNFSECNKEEIEYLSIAELHDQIDDDKNGNIDITESNDFVKQSLASSRGTEKAKIFHKNDAQIDKQDLWHIWRTSEVSNWTMEELVYWLSNEVKLPQYNNIFRNLKLNGSSLPRLTGNNYLLNVVGISNSIHRKKIIIKAVDTVLFGSSKDFRFASKWILLGFVTITLIIIYLSAQTIYSKQYVKDLQNKLESLGERESSLSELRNKIKEAEEFKQMKNNEIQEMEERHRFELSSNMSYSNDSLSVDSEKLQNAYNEIKKLKAALVESHSQLNKLSNNPNGSFLVSSSNEDGHMLQSLLQLTHGMERQYLAEKIASVDRQSMEFKEMNEKVKKRKSAFMGSFRLIHSNDLDELEKGFALTKSAYESLIHDKNEQEKRWSKLENITGFNLTPCGDTSGIKQVIRWSTHVQSNYERTSSSASNLCLSTEAVDMSNESQEKSSQDNLLIKPDILPSDKHSLHNIKNQSSQDSTNSSTLSSVDVPNSEINIVKLRSKKDFSDKWKPLFGVGKTMIASLNRSTKKNA